MTDIGHSDKVKQRLSSGGFLKDSRAEFEILPFSLALGPSPSFGSPNGEF